MEQAEEILIERNFRQVRVRLNEGAARVEVGCEEVDRLRELWPEIAAELRRLGLTEAFLDPDGYRYGGADHTAGSVHGRDEGAR